ncbi:MAG: hypothetical protein AAF645_14370 [Myxococcota bacterium]
MPTMLLLVACSSLEVQPAGGPCVRSLECAVGLACVEGVCSADTTGLIGQGPPEPGEDMGMPVDLAVMDGAVPPDMAVAPDMALVEAGVDLAAPEMGMDMAAPEIGMDMAPPEMGMDMAPEDMAMDMAPADMGMDMAPEEMGVDMGAMDVAIEAGDAG